MNEGEFLDTNILVYAADRNAGAKHQVAIELMERVGESRTGCLSIQVLQEYYVAVTKKFAMPPGDALRQIERMGRWRVHQPAVADVLAACEVHARQPVSFWDAMIIRSAAQLGCQVLWSEDLTDGWQWQGVTVRNPFAGPVESLDSK